MSSRSGDRPAVADAGGVIREEFEALRGELARSARQAGAGAGLVAAAGACGALSLAAGHGAALAALERVLPRPLAAGALAGVYAAGAAALALEGRRRLRDVSASVESVADTAGDVASAAGEALGALR